jgi:UDP-glucose 4-epimerase
MAKVLIVGGAGYIGSHMVKMLLAQGHQVVVLDNLSTGYRDAVVGGEFIEGDMGDEALLAQLFSEHEIEAVMHFASFIEVGESVTDPIKYYHNNVVKTLALLNAMVRHKVQKIIFSSTAAVYGEPEYVPIDEDHPLNPINPYGKGKLMVEKILEDYDRAYALKSISLRYFNAAGADPDGELGERHNPESHLIPLILQAASGRRETISIFGSDYDTIDGTCVRDYIHIVDLCAAHLKALEKLISGANSAVYNLGNGNGFSVQQVIDCARKVSGNAIKVVTGERREGDPATLIARSDKAKQELGWVSSYDKIETIVSHAWRWEQSYPFGRK